MKMPFSLLTLLSIAVMAIGTSGSDSDYPSGSGFDSNYPNSFDSGYPSDYSPGYPSGSGFDYTSGFDSNYPNSFDSGYPSDYSPGYPSGSGFDYTSGFDSNYPSSFDSGYPSDYSSGYPSGSGFDSNYPNSFDSGYPSDYSSGYPSGSGFDYTSGFDSNYPSSFDPGLPGYSGYPLDSGSGYPSGSGSDYPGDSGSYYPGDSGTNYPSDSGSGSPGDSGSYYSGDSGTNYPSDSGSNYTSGSGSDFPGDSGSYFPGDSDSNYPSGSGSDYPGDADSTVYPQDSTLHPNDSTVQTTASTVHLNGSTLNPSDPTLLPNDSTVQPTGPTLNPSDPTLLPNNSTVYPHDSTLHPNDSTVQTNLSTVHPNGSTLNPSDPTLLPNDSTVQPTGPTLNPSDTTLLPNGSTVQSTASTVSPTGPTLNPSDTTLLPNGSTVQSTASTVSPTGPTLNPSDTTLLPNGSTVQSTASTVSPTGPTLNPSDTTLLPNGSTVQSTASTVSPTGPTLNPSDTTLLPNDSTVQSTASSVTPTGPTLNPSDTTLPPNDSTGQPTASTDHSSGHSSDNPASTMAPTTNAPSTTTTTTPTTRSAFIRDPFAQATMPDASGRICDSNSCDIGNPSLWTNAEAMNGVVNYYAKCAYAVPTQPGYSHFITLNKDGIPVDESPDLSSEAAVEHFLVAEDGDLSLNAEYSCNIKIFANGTKIAEENSPVLKLFEFPDEISFASGEDANFDVVSMFPLLCENGGSCFVDVMGYTPGIDCNGAMFGFFDQNTCGVRIHGVLSRDLAIDPEQRFHHTLSYTAFPPLQYNMDDAVNYSQSTSWSMNPSANAPGWWGGQLDDPTQVTVVKSDVWKNKTCAINPGGKGWDFNGRPFSASSKAVYNFYDHSTECQVQVFTEVASDNRSYSTCGVKVRCGRDVYWINHCVKRHFDGFTQNEDAILSVRKVSSNEFEITFPWGTKVSLLYFLNIRQMGIIIYASPFDVDEDTGLCGTIDSTAGTVGTASPDMAAFTASDVMANDFSGWDFEDDTVGVCLTAGSPTFVTTYGKLCPSTLRGSSWTKTPGKDEADSARRVAETMSNYTAAISTAPEGTIGPTDQVSAGADMATALGANFVLNDIIDTVPIAPDVFNNLEAAALDLYLTTNDLDTWSRIAGSIGQAIVKQSASMNPAFQQYYPVEYAQVGANPCLGNCYGQGSCNAASETCSCNSGHGGDNCDIDLSATIEVQAVDEPIQDPTSFAAEGKCIRVPNSGSTDTTMCRFIEYTATASGGFASNTQWIFLAEFISTNEVQCCQPSSRRRKRSTSSSIASQVQVAISNDGTTFSDPITVTVLDSTCVSVDSVSNIATLQSGYCLISGTCYTNGTVDTSNTCSICVTDLDLYAWSTDTGNAACQTPTSSSDDDDESTIAIAVGVSVSVVAILLIGGALGGVYLYKKKYARKCVKPNIDLFDPSEAPAKMKFNIRKEESWIRSESPIPAFRPQLKNKKTESQVPGPSINHLPEIPRLNTPEGADRDHPKPSKPSLPRMPATYNPMINVSAPTMDISQPAVYIEPTFPEPVYNYGSSGVLTLNEQI